MKILIFTASAGNGHNSTANRIKERVLAENPNAEIEIVDVYKSYAGRIKRWIMEQGYFFVCNHFVGLYNHFFKKSEKCTIETKDTAKVHKQVDVLLYGMLNKIYEFKPDVIISTYIFAAIALRNLRRVYNIPAKIMCMTLDYGISPYWECCAEGLDKMFITNNDMLPYFKNKGYTDEKLVVSGIPVASKFSSPIEVGEARKILGLKDMFTITVMKASFFPISNKTLIKQLSKVETPIQIVFVNGKDEASRKEIDKLIKKYKLNHNTVNIGFTDKIVEYFSASNLVLGKAGGLTTTESINCGLPSLILDKLPQQEIYNKKYLVENGCALAVTGSTIAKTINHLLENKDEYKKLKQNCINLRRFDTMDLFYKEIADTKEANYLNLTINDTKKSLIKRAKKARLGRG